MVGATAQKIGLPDPGAIGDQDNYIMECFGVIEFEFMMFCQEQSKENEKKNPTKQPGRNG